MAIMRSIEAEYKQYRAAEVKIINDLAVRFSDVCVHTFQLGDVEDPDLYAGEPLWDWQQSEAGKWVMENAVEKPYWVRHMDHISWNYNFKIMARMTEQNETFFRLKYQK